jgi:hypothetical protein
MSCAIWSNYAGAGPLLRFVRVGTLDQPDYLPPDIHIYTELMQPWVKLAGNAPVMAQYYDREQYLSAASQSRRAALLPSIVADLAGLKKAQL